MGTAMCDDWAWQGVHPAFPPRAVRCVLVLRDRPVGTSDKRESIRQTVYLVLHSDSLYHVGWLAYEGAQEPFDQDTLADLEAVDCDLGLK